MASRCSRPELNANSIWIGFDPRPEEAEGFGVARHSIKRRLSEDVPIYALSLSRLANRRAVLSRQPRGATAACGM